MPMFSETTSRRVFMSIWLATILTMPVSLQVPILVDNVLEMPLMGSSQSLVTLWYSLLRSCDEILNGIPDLLQTVGNAICGTFLTFMSFSYGLSYTILSYFFFLFLACGVVALLASVAGQAFCRAWDKSRSEMERKTKEHHEALIAAEAEKSKWQKMNETARLREREHDDECRRFKDEIHLLRLDNKSKDDLIQRMNQQPSRQFTQPSWLIARDPQGPLARKEAKKEYEARLKVKLASINAEHEDKLKTEVTRLNADNEDKLHVMQIKIDSLESAAEAARNPHKHGFTFSYDDSDSSVDGDEEPQQQGFRVPEASSDEE